MWRSPTSASVRAPPSWDAGRLCAVSLFPTDASGAIDALEEAVRESIEGEATWLETQHALLRRALLQLHALCSSGDSHIAPSITQAERTLQLVSAAMRERLTSLDSAAAALRSE